MTEEEFHAKWNALIDAAIAQGDYDKVERLMIEYNEAFCERHPVVDTQQ